MDPPQQALPQALPQAQVCRGHNSLPIHPVSPSRCPVPSQLSSFYSRPGLGPDKSARNAWVAGPWSTSCMLQWGPSSSDAPRPGPGHRCSLACFTQFWHERGRSYCGIGPQRPRAAGGQKYIISNGPSPNLSFCFIPLQVFSIYPIHIVRRSECQSHSLLCSHFHSYLSHHCLLSSVLPLSLFSSNYLLSIQSLSVRSINYPD